MLNLVNRRKKSKYAHYLRLHLSKWYTAGENFLSRNVAVALVICCALLAADLSLLSGVLAPKSVPPTDIIREAVWRSKSAGALLPEADIEWKSVTNWKTSHILQRSVGEIERLRDLFAGIGGFRQPIKLIVSAQAPDVFSISSTELLIGENWLACEGQLLHGLLQVWILQNVAPEWRSSIFRQQLLTDEIMLLWTAHLNLEVKQSVVGGMRTVHLERLLPGQDGGPSPWLRAIRSWRYALSLPWMPAGNHFRAFDANLNHPTVSDLTSEKAGFAATVAPLSLRPIFDHTIQKALGQLNLSARIEILKTLAAVWSQPPKNPVKESGFPTSAVDWRQWVLAEISGIAPWITGEALASNSALMGTKVNGVVIADNKSVIEDSRLQENSSLLAILPEGYFLWPAMIRLSAEEAQAITTEKLLWASCRPPEVQELLGRAAKFHADHILFAHSCGRGLDLRHYLNTASAAESAKEFARQNPALSFVQLHRPSLQVAVKNGLGVAVKSFFQVLTESRSRPSSKDTAEKFAPKGADIGANSGADKGAKKVEKQRDTLLKGYAELGVDSIHRQWIGELSAYSTQKANIEAIQLYRHADTVRGSWAPEKANVYF